MHAKTPLHHAVLIKVIRRCSAATDLGIKAEYAPVLVRTCACMQQRLAVQQQLESAQVIGVKRVTVSDALESFHAPTLSLARVVALRIY